MKRPHAAGSSLLELLLIFLTLTVLGVISVPALGALGTGQRLKQETQLLESALKESAIKSILTGRLVAVTFSTHGYYAAFVENSDQPLEAREIAAPVQLTPPHSQSIIFRGGGTASPATTILSDDKSKCEIVVSLRGRIRALCKKI